MWCRRTVSSCRDIQVLRFGQNFITKVVAEESDGVQVDFSAEQCAELVLHREEIEAGRVAVLEFDENVQGASHLGWHGQTCLPVVLPASTGKLALVHGTRWVCHPFRDARERPRRYPPGNRPAARSRRERAGEYGAGGRTPRFCPEGYQAGNGSSTGVISTGWIQIKCAVFRGSFARPPCPGFDRPGTLPATGLLGDLVHDNVLYDPLSTTTSAGRSRPMCDSSGLDDELNKIPHRPLGWTSATARLIEVCEADSS